MKDVVILLGRTEHIQEYQAYCKALAKPAELLVCSAGSPVVDYPFLSLPFGKELKTIDAYIKKNQQTVRAVINRVDQYEQLHGELVDHFQVTGPSYNAIVTLSNKSRMHQLMLEADLAFYRPQTLVCDLDQVEKHLRLVQYPIVIKAYAGAKSRGVFVLNKPEDYQLYKQQLYAHYETEKVIVSDKADQKIVLLEQYVQGKQVTPVCYVDAKGKVHILALVDVITAHDIGQEHMQLIFRSTPSHFGDHIRQKMQFVLQRLVKRAGLTSVCLHPEFFISGKNLYLIEVNVRIGGFRAVLMETAFNINLNKLCFDLALDLEIQDEVDADQSATAVEVWREESGIISRIDIPQSKHIFKRKVHVEVGDEYIAPPQAHKPLATFFVKARDNSLSIAKKLYKKHYFDIS